MNLLFFVIFFLGFCTFFFLVFITDIKKLSGFRKAAAQENELFNLKGGNFSYSHRIDYNEKDEGILQTNIDQYFKIMKNAIKKAESEIIIVDYTKHGKHLEKIDSDIHLFYNISRHYEDYYCELEKIITNKEVEYNRIICLPPSQKNLKDLSKILYNAVRYVFYGTYKHLKKLKNNPNFNLYILPGPIRTNSLIIIDKKIVLFEYDSYGPNLECRPDLLFIHFDDNLATNEYNKVKERIHNISKINVDDLLAVYLEKIINPKTSVDAFGKKNIAKTDLTK